MARSGRSKSGRSAKAPTRFAEAREAHTRGDLPRAERLYRKALQLDPGHLDACYLLGTVLAEQGEARKAIFQLERALKMQPTSVQVLNNLANAHRMVGERDAALALLERAESIDPNLAVTWLNLGHLLKSMRRYERAAPLLRKVVVRAPGDRPSWLALGDALLALGDRGEALRCYTRARDLDPSAVDLQMRMSEAAGAVPGRTGDAQTLEHYRERAADWSARTAGERFRYAGPAVLLRAVLPHLSPPLDVLDLGCGTGLAAADLRPLASTLVGVDLSPEMLDSARSAGVYDALYQAEITRWLSDSDQRFGLVFAAGVFIHFGDLSGILTAIAGVLEPGGMVGFTTYAADGDRPVILEHSFFGHPQAHIMGAAQAAGLDVVVLDAFTHDLVQGVEVPGWTVICQAPAALVAE